MRRILHGDIVAAARALLAVRECDRGDLIRRMMMQAKVADKYRRAYGCVHPMWGDGSLEVVAAMRGQMPKPYLDVPEFCNCMIVVFEALLHAGTR